MRRYVCLDTETTGLSVVSDRLCEVAAIEFDPITFAETRRFHVYLNPERPVSPGALRVHGLTDDFLAQQPRFGDVAGDLAHFLTHTEVFIHNASFDVRFLNQAFSNLNLPPLDALDCRPQCTLKLARRMLKLPHHRLDDLCRHFDVSLQRRTQHGAMIDTELLLAVLQRMRPSLAGS